MQLEISFEWKEYLNTKMEEINSGEGKTYESGEVPNGNPPAVVIGQRGFDHDIIEPGVYGRNLSRQIAGAEEGGGQVGDHFGAGEFVVFVRGAHEGDALSGDGVLEQDTFREEFEGFRNELLRALGGR